MRLKTVTASLVDGLFRREETARPIWWALVLPLLGALSTVLGLLRLGSSWDTMYGEDGVEFYNSQRHFGYWHGLLRGYEGYLHLLPRTITLVASQLPLRDLPYGFTVGTCAITGFVSVVIARALPAYGAPRPVAAVVALVVPVAPLALFESLGGAENIQWMIVGGLFWALLWNPRELRWVVTLSAFAFLTIGSAPLALALTPLALLRILFLKGRERAVGIAFVLGALLQGWTMLHTARSITGEKATPLAALQTTAVRLFTTAWFGVGWTEDGFAKLGWLLVVAVGVLWALLVLGALLDVRSRWLLACAVVAATALFLAGSLGNFSGIFADGHTRADIQLLGSGRYANSPIVVLVTASLAASWAGVRRSRWLLAIPGLAAAVLLGAVVNDWHYPAPRNVAPTWRTTLTTAEQQCAGLPPDQPHEIGVAPGEGFDVIVSCREIDAAG